MLNVATFLKTAVHKESILCLKDARATTTATAAFQLHFIRRYRVSFDLLFALGRG